MLGLTARPRLFLLLLLLFVARRMVDFGEDVADDGAVMMAYVSYESDKEIQVVKSRKKSEKIYFLPYHLVYNKTAEEK